MYVFKANIYEMNKDKIKYSINKYIYLFIFNMYKLCPLNFK